MQPLPHLEMSESGPSRLSSVASRTDGGGGGVGGDDGDDDNTDSINFNAYAATSPAPNPNANAAASTQPLAHTDAKAERAMPSRALGSAPAGKRGRWGESSASERGGELPATSSILMMVRRDSCEEDDAAM